MKEKMNKPRYILFLLSSQFTAIYASNVVAVYDTERKVWLSSSLPLSADIIEADMSYFELTAYTSHFPDLWTAKFDRNREGEIVFAQLPKKLTVDEVAALMKPKKRKQVARQLSNLQQLKPEDRFQKKKLATDDVLDRVVQLRADGHSWASVGKVLGINSTTLKVAYHKQKATEQACNN